jgi:putative DNA-invertase from lambdoid prophage Rac
MRIPEQIVSLSTGPGFMRILDRLDAEDVLIVTKLDRLGRNAIDVASRPRALPAIDQQAYHCQGATIGGLCETRCSWG